MQQVDTDKDVNVQAVQTRSQKKVEGKKLHELKVTEVLDLEVTDIKKAQQTDLDVQFLRELNKIHRGKFGRMIIIGVFSHHILSLVRYSNN